MYKAFSNFLVYKTDTLFEDHVKYKGLGGRDLVIDPMFNPAQHCRIHGEVVSTPKYLGSIPLYQFSRGLPPYSEYAPASWKLISDIKPDVEVSDRVYVHFNTIKPYNFVQIDGVHPNRTWYIRCRYDSVICTVRDEKIIPIGSYILVEADKESWEDILHPTYSNIKDKEGNFILKPKDQWIQTKVAPQNKWLLGFVRHMGSPLEGETCVLEPGDRIIYRRLADWTVRIEGKEYFAIMQRHIIGRYVGAEFEPIDGRIVVRPEIIPDVTPAGIHVKKQSPIRGEVLIPGKNPVNSGDFVEFGDCDRTEFELKGEKVIAINFRDVWGITEYA